jgi:hypothetical protein
MESERVRVAREVQSDFARRQRAVTTGLMPPLRTRKAPRVLETPRKVCFKLRFPNCTDGKTSLHGIVHGRYN